jgi:hypothetical protein
MQTSKIISQLKQLYNPTNSKSGSTFHLKYNDYCYDCNEDQIDYVIASNCREVYFLCDDCFEDHVCICDCRDCELEEASRTLFVGSIDHTR